MLAPSRSPRHSNLDGIGENLYYSGGTGAEAVKWDDAVFSWYAENADWDYAAAQSTGGVTGHFTQARPYNVSKNAEFLPMLFSSSVMLRSFGVQPLTAAILAVLCRP
jgi:hypothetical protein